MAGNNVIRVLAGSTEQSIIDTLEFARISASEGECSKVSFVFYGRLVEADFMPYTGEFLQTDRSNFDCFEWVQNNIHHGTRTSVKYAMLDASVEVVIHD